jgi:hypothetical protein
MLDSKGHYAGGLAHVLARVLRGHLAKRLGGSINIRPVYSPPESPGAEFCEMLTLLLIVSQQKSCVPGSTMRRGPSPGRLPTP